MITYYLYLVEKASNPYNHVTSAAEVSIFYTSNTKEKVHSNYLKKTAYILAANLNFSCDCYKSLCIGFNTRRPSRNLNNIITWKTGNPASFNNIFHSFSLLSFPPLLCAIISKSSINPMSSNKPSPSDFNYDHFSSFLRYRLSTVRQDLNTIFVSPIMHYPLRFKTL